MVAERVVNNPFDRKPDDLSRRSHQDAPALSGVRRFCRRPFAIQQGETANAAEGRYSLSMNITPIWVSSRQMALQILAGSPANIKSNTSGMPTVV